MRRSDPASLHEPVMLTRVTQLLLPALVGPEAAAGPAVHVDCTLGMGGHAEAVLEAAPEAIVIGIDRDPEALDLAGRRLTRFGDRFRPVHAVYDEIADVIDAEGFSRAGSVLFDLGVSSLQVDADDRGFAYRADAPLDMRMDQTQGMSAADLLNTAPVEELTRILREYGEERFARKIARRVAVERERQPFTRSARLVTILGETIPAASQRTGGHPAKRTFQALRIAVNSELDALSRAVPGGMRALAVGGRIAVLSYHSLEDRLVKRALTAASTGSTPPGLPVELPEHAPTHRLLTKGAEEPPAEQVALNPRAASAKLRAAVRVREGNLPDVASNTAPDRYAHRSKGRSR